MIAISDNTRFILYIIALTGGFVFPLLEIIFNEALRDCFRKKHGDHSQIIEPDETSEQTSGGEHSQIIEPNDTSEQTSGGEHSQIIEPNDTSEQTSGTEDESELEQKRNYACVLVIVCFITSVLVGAFAMSAPSLSKSTGPAKILESSPL